MTREEALRTAAEVLQQTVSRDPYIAPSPVPTDELLRVAEWLLVEDALDVAPTVALAKPEAKLRKFKDKDGDEWREREDGGFDCYHAEFDGFHISSVFLGYSLNSLRNRWGPLTEITE